MRTPATLLLISLLAACTTDPVVDNPTNNAPAGTNAATPTASDRDRTQKPEEVIALMGGDLTGLTIADLFADDGYFTFKMITAGANVIAIVNDADKAAMIETRKKELGLGDDRLQVRAVPVGDPGLSKEEVDMAIIVHNFVKIADKNTYFERMRNGVRAPRPLIMVEWQYNETANGPSLAERLPTETIMDMIGQYGYSDVGAHSAKIPDQVIFMINDYMDVGAQEQVPAP